MENNEDLLKAIYRQDFYSFLQRVFADVGGNANFQPNWHIEVIVHYLQLAMEGKERRLIINLPPRHLKSISLSSSRRSVNDFETTLGGGRFSTSMGGTITGRGGNYLIIDDPIKPADSNSEVLREKVNDSYGTTLYSRLDNKKEGRIIVVMQRSHENDFTGYLLASDPSFKQIKMPIIAEEDECWTVRNRPTGREKP